MMLLGYITLAVLFQLWTTLILRTEIILPFPLVTSYLLIRQGRLSSNFCFITDRRYCCNHSDVTYGMNTSRQIGQETNEKTYIRTEYYSNHRKCWMCPPWGLPPLHSVGDISVPLPISKLMVGPLRRQRCQLSTNEDLHDWSQAINLSYILPFINYAHSCYTRNLSV